MTFKANAVIREASTTNTCGSVTTLTLSFSYFLISEDVKMPVSRLTPILLCFLSAWRILTPASSHPQHSRCQLVRFHNLEPSSNSILKNAWYLLLKLDKSRCALSWLRQLFFSLLLVKMSTLTLQLNYTITTKTLCRSSHSFCALIFPTLPHQEGKMRNNSFIEQSKWIIHVSLVHK